MAAVRWARAGIVVKVLALVVLAAVGTAAIIISGTALRSDSSAPSVEKIVAAGSPGALLLVDDGSSRKEKTSGLAVMKGRVPLDAHDRFRVGSITKTFVAVVVLQLVSEHRLALGDTVERWLPGLVPDGGRITLRQLLAHRSGLADYVDDAAFVRRTGAQPRRQWAPRELVAVARAEGRVAPPGVRFAYASTNYILLGLVVERATRTSLGLQLRRRIFAPLGLDETVFAYDLRDSQPYAHGYAPSQYDGIVGSLATARDRSAANSSWAWAAGSVVSTASDLSRFFGALLQGRLLSPRQLGLMRPSRRSRYGLGLAAFRTPCGTAIGHTGALLGTVSAVWSSPDGRRRVVAMSNSLPLASPAGVALKQLLNESFCG
jgi:D-alanyl-D-alanine carboxypeptidase